MALAPRHVGRSHGSKRHVDINAKAKKEQASQSEKSLETNNSRHNSDDEDGSTQGNREDNECVLVAESEAGGESARCSDRKRRVLEKLQGKIQQNGGEQVVESEHLSLSSKQPHDRTQTETDAGERPGDIATGKTSSEKRNCRGSGSSCNSVADVHAPCNCAKWEDDGPKFADEAEERIARRMAETELVSSSNKLTAVARGLVRISSHGVKDEAKHEYSENNSDIVAPCIGCNNSASHVVVTAHHRFRFAVLACQDFVLRVGDCAVRRSVRVILAGYVLRVFGHLSSRASLHRTDNAAARVHFENH